MRNDWKRILNLIEHKYEGCARFKRNNGDAAVAEQMIISLIRSLRKAISWMSEEGCCPEDVEIVMEDIMDMLIGMLNED